METSFMPKDFRELTSMEPGMGIRLSTEGKTLERVYWGCVPLGISPPYQSEGFKTLHCGVNRSHNCPEIFLGTYSIPHPEEVKFENGLVILPTDTEFSWTSVIEKLALRRDEFHSEKKYQLMKKALQLQGLWRVKE